MPDKPSGEQFMARLDKEDLPRIPRERPWTPMQSWPNEIDGKILRCKDKVCVWWAKCLCGASRTDGLIPDLKSHVASPTVKPTVLVTCVSYKPRRKSDGD